MRPRLEQRRLSLSDMEGEQQIEAMEEMATAMVETLRDAPDHTLGMSDLFTETQAKTGFKRSDILFGFYYAVDCGLISDQSAQSKITLLERSVA